MIPLELRNLCDDIECQLEYNSYSIDEIAARLHFRMVWIHPFPNGNGRHGRLYTDLFLISHDRPRFSWGKSNLSHSNETRKKYIQALHVAA
jgi:Fic family protein